MNKKSYPKLHSIKFKRGIYADNVIYPEAMHQQTPEIDIPAINVLEGAVIEKLRSVVIAGYTEQGKEYIASTYRNPKESAYLFSRGTLRMLRYGDGYDEPAGDPAA